MTLDHIENNYSNLNLSLIIDCGGGGVISFLQNHKILKANGFALLKNKSYFVDKHINSQILEIPRQYQNLFYKSTLNKCTLLEQEYMSLVLLNLNLTEFILKYLNVRIFFSLNKRLDRYRLPPLWPFLSLIVQANYNPKIYVLPMMVVIFLLCLLFLLPAQISCWQHTSNKGSRQNRSPTIEMWPMTYQAK